MRESILKLMDICNDFDHVWIEIGSYFDDRLCIIGLRNGVKCKFILTREEIESIKDCELLIKEVMRKVDNSLKAESEVK